MALITAEATMPNHLARNDNRDPGWADQLLAFAPDLRKYARSLCYDTEAADDLVQETFLRAWASAGSFESGTNLGAWLFTILRNGFLSDRRKRGRVVEDPDGAHAARLQTPPAQESHLERQDLVHALTRLHDDQRDALLLVAVQGLSYEDAALACSCPIGTIKSRVQRARTRLAALMGLDLRADFGPDQVTRAALQLAA
jgi:RNA polymerase sigma-70 factor (ECF subfamily)